MKFSSPLIVVSDMENSKRFYYEVLGLEVNVDFGANVTLTGGIALQTKDTWLTFIHKKESEIVFGGNVAELYFEEDDFDGFILKINDIADINYVHPIVEHLGDSVLFVSMTLISILLKSEKILLWLSDDS